MDKLIENIINEKFASKAQQRFFYAKANEKGSPKKDKKKWSKWAKEFSDDTNFKKIPEKVRKPKKKVKEEDVDEVVDELGNIARSHKPTNAETKGVTQRKTTDDVVKTGAGSMGIHGVHGTHTSLRYWAESELDGALGFNQTMGDDKNYENAKKYFIDDLGLDDAEAEDRMAQLGYDKKLAKVDSDKIRLVENPKTFIESYIDEVLLKKKDVEELVNKTEPEGKEINPIILKQLSSLKKIMNNNDLSISDIAKYLKDNE